MLWHSPEEEFLDIEDDEFDKCAYLGAESLNAAKGFSIPELPAFEAAISPGGKVIHDFSVVVFGC